MKRKNSNSVTVLFKFFLVLLIIFFIQISDGCNRMVSEKVNALSNVETTDAELTLSDAETTSVNSDTQNIIRAIESEQSLTDLIEYYEISDSDMEDIEKDYYYMALDQRQKGYFLQMYGSMKKDPKGIIRLNFDPIYDTSQNHAIYAYTSSAIFQRFGNVSYLKGSYYDYNNLIRDVKVITVEEVNMDAYEADLLNAVLDAYQYADFYNRCQSIHDFVVNHYDYDYENTRSVENHVAGGNSDGKGVCESIAKFCASVFSYCGIPSIVAVGKNHAFNLVYSEEEQVYYIFDATWDMVEKNKSWLLIGTDSAQILDPGESHIINSCIWVNDNVPKISEKDFAPEQNNYNIPEYQYNNE